MICTLGIYADVLKPSVLDLWGSDKWTPHCVVVHVYVLYITIQ